MKVNDPNLSASLASQAAAQATSQKVPANTAGQVNNGQVEQTRSTRQAERVAPAAGTRATGISTGESGASGSSDDVHLSELVRSLRSLAADSPERQAQIEQIARSYAAGTYQVDPQAAAQGIIDDALRYH